MTKFPLSASSVTIDSVLAFIRGGNLLNGSKPGFSHALKLSYNTISKERLSIGSGSLSYRYSFCEHVQNPTLGLFVALMDELSTDAVFRVGLPAAPGATLQMQAEIIDNELPTNDIDIVNTVTKLGKTISHTRTEFICALTQKPLAYASQVKYMPTGNWYMDLVFGNKFFYDLYSNYIVGESAPIIYEEKHLIRDVILSNLEIQLVSGRGIFRMNKEHTNPFGAMHGGCHAMVMERMGNVYAKHQLNSDTVVLKAMQIEFLKAAKGTIHIDCETIIKKDDEIHVRVLLKREDGKIFSEGKLRFLSSCHVTRDTI